MLNTHKNTQSPPTDASTHSVTVVNRLHVHQSFVGLSVCRPDHYSGCVGLPCECLHGVQEWKLLHITIGGEQYANSVVAFSLMLESTPQPWWCKNHALTNRAIGARTTACVVLGQVYIQLKGRPW